MAADLAKLPVVPNSETAARTSVPALYASRERRPKRQYGADHLQGADGEPAGYSSVNQHVGPDVCLHRLPLFISQFIDHLVAAVPKLLLVGGRFG